jgi:transcriptional regulator with GAF, ATPase, and Fis domain
MSTETKATETPYVDGDPFLKQFLPGDSPAMKKLRGLIYALNVAHKNRRMVPSILLLGERGVGKGYTAHAIAAHLGWLISSKGRDLEPAHDSDVYQLARLANMRTQSLTAVPEHLAEATLFGFKKGAFTDAKESREGLFDSAEIIDIFIDEIGDATPNIQAKLLQVLETRTFRPLGMSFSQPDLESQARAIFATNRDLRDLVAKDKFREDLLDRLMWSPIYLPPLREQAQEIPMIVHRMNAQLESKYGLPHLEPKHEDLVWSQKSYDWRGNHRELQQVLWSWRMSEETRSFAEIVEQRSVPRMQTSESHQALIAREITKWLKDIRSGALPGFKTYGDFGDELKTIGYRELYELNRREKLTGEQISHMFTTQEPINIRKQISANRSGA